MREIKFRSWDGDTMEYDICVGRHSKDSSDCPNNTVVIIDDGDCWFPHDPSYIGIMQYTGMKDKNSREIYEGDMIKFDDFYIGDHREPGGTAEVKYVDDGYGLYISDDYVCCIWDAVKNYNAEIVGNIYEK